MKSLFAGARLKTAAGLGLLLLLALGLRTWGLGWGLPDAGRYYPYHPDESVLLHAVCTVNPLWGDFQPGIETLHDSVYNYGSLYILLSRLAYDFAAGLLGWASVPRFGTPFAEWVGDFARLLWTGRCVAVALGVGTVAAAWGLGRTLFGARSGWITAGLLAVAPIAVMLGHYMTVDVPAAFFTTLALLFAALALRRPADRRVVGWLAACGLAAGLATGTKYNSFPALFAALVPLWAVMRRGEAVGRRAAVLGAGAALLACGAGFLLSTPGALLDTPAFWKDLSYEMGRNTTGQGLIFQATPPAALYHLGISLPVGLEWPLYLLVLAGIVTSLRRRRPEDALLWLFVLPSFLLLCSAERKFVRYVVPLVPPLLVLAARCLDEGMASPRRRFWIAWGGAAGAAALASTVAHLGVLSAPDARDQAVTYLRENARPSDIVALGADAWYYSPPFDPTTGCVKRALAYGGPPVWDQQPPGMDLCSLPAYRVLAPRSTPPAGALPIAKLRRYRPKWVILTDYEYEDPERIARHDPSFHSGILELEEALRVGYHLGPVFRPRPSLAGFTWWREGIPPHDWRYYMPTVRIYTRDD